MRRKYSKLSLTEVCFEPRTSILLSSIKAEEADVTVVEFEDVKDADNHNFFKVEFE